MTFDAFCRQHNVTNRERDELAFWLVTRRAWAAFRILRAGQPWDAKR